MFWKKIKESFWLEVTALAAISAFVYAVHLNGLSYYRDDWYYMYDGLAGGGKIFVEMFRHLRPLRGPLFEFLFGLFGTNPQPYLILLYIWRLVGALGALWLFRILWPKQRSATFFMAALFLIYPGFLWWVQGFEYQPMVLSVGLQIFSIVFTLKAIQSVSRRDWVLWILAALLTGWVYLAFVEYAIGMEVFRWLCVYLLISHTQQRSWPQRVIATVRASAVSILAPFAFLVWRLFIFDNERKAADVGLQVGAVFDSSNTALWWLVRFFQSVLNVSIFAWATPFNQNFFSLRLKDVLIAIALMAVVVVISYFLFKIMQGDEEPASPPSWQLEAVSMGLLSIGAGVLPIIAANRVVTFERFSHYALPASVAGVMFIVGLVYLLTDKRIRFGVLALLIGISVMTHAALASQARSEEGLIRNFWQQVVWRVPDLRAGTVLMVNYPGINYAEGTDIVWGPANFIYYPESQKQVPVVVSVAAARMEADTPRNILEGAQLSQTYIIVNDIQYDFDNLLVMTMPSENSCMHVLDGKWAELSTADSALTALAAPKSRMDNVIAQAEPHTPPEVLFGKEPAHEWCYYYQAAQLARQTEDWKAIIQIEQTVEKLGMHPNDQVEWMPFLQAAAVLGDEKQVKQISTRINTEQLYKQQACQNLRAMGGLTPAMQTYISGLFCGGQ